MPEEVEKFDWKQTLSCNVVMVFGVAVIILYISAFVNLMEIIEGDSAKLLSVIIFAVSTIKLVTWIGLRPVIVFKTKKGRLTYQ